MRAMVFGTEADTLVVKATSEEVRLFAAGQQVYVKPKPLYTLSEAVAYLFESGWSLEAKSEEMFPMPAGLSPHRPAVRCRLETMCGCVRHEWSEMPAPREIRRPVGALRPATIDDGDWTTNVLVTIRRFVHHEVERAKNGAVTFVYREMV